MIDPTNAPHGYFARRQSRPLTCFEDPDNSDPCSAPKAEHGFLFRNKRRSARVSADQAPHRDADSA